MLTDISDFLSFILCEDEQNENKNLKRKRVEDDEGPSAKRSAFIVILDESEASEVPTTDISTWPMKLHQHEFAMGMRGVHVEDHPEYIVESPAAPTTHNEPVYIDYSEYAQHHSTYQDIRQRQYTQNSRLAYEQLQQFHHCRFTQNLQPIYQPQQLMQNRQAMLQNMKLQHNQHATESYYEEYQPKRTQKASAVKVQRQRRPRKAPLHQRPISIFFSHAANIAVVAPPSFESSNGRVAIPKKVVKKSQVKKTLLQ